MTEVMMEFELEEELVEAARKVCEENGMTLEEAIRRFFEEAVAMGDFPFDPDPEILEDYPKLKEHIEKRRRRKTAGME